MKPATMGTETRTGVRATLKKTRKRKRTSVRAALWGAAGGAAFVGVFFAGRYVALADTPGTPGGKSIDSVGFAGTLRQDGKGMPAGTYADR